tara:strand:+ start:785 stop:1714 length:930 start_codon:yes stop_codon:yes gene_type:complete
MSQEVQGNSETQVDLNNQPEEVFDSEDTFFDDLERAVNGGILDPQEESEKPHQVEQSATPQANPAMQAPQQEVPGQPTDWETRYKDSSREAQKMHGQNKHMQSTLQSIGPYLPILNAMKQDPGMVDHMRQYIQGAPGAGKKAPNLKEALNLEEDFEPDFNQAFSDPKSDSAKYVGTLLNGLVDNRVNKIMTNQQSKAAKAMKANQLKQEEMVFKKKHGMNDEDFAKMKAAAKRRKLSMDDIYYLLNKDAAKQNIAQNTKQQMLDQMKNVRNIQPSVSNANNAGKTGRSVEDSIFDSMKGLDSDLDNLFG